MGRKEGSKARLFPVHTLDQALVIVQAIADKGAGQTMDRLLVADAIGRTPNSSAFRRLLSSSLRYELTTGTEKADYITPTPLGLKIAKPISEEERRQGLVEASLKPELMGKILRHFNRNKLPDTSFLKNTLEKAFAVAPAHSGELAKLLVANAKFCSILQSIAGGNYIRIDAQPPTASAQEQQAAEAAAEAAEGGAEAESPRVEPDRTTPPVAPQPDKPKQIFVAHGKNQKPLQDLKKVLDQFKIPYKVAADEPHAGRPISNKVAELMRGCSAGIFIFTRDEKFQREDGEEVWRPSENVVYELGAASILWENKIIILKEKGVNFPSDFSDLGYITFEDGKIATKALDLLRELVALEFVKVQAT